MIVRLNSTLFMPDSILPVQYHPSSQAKTRRSGEMRLLWAVLEEAYTCVMGMMTACSGDLAKYKAALEAHAWFMVGNVGVEPFTFNTICAVFGLSESRLRAYAHAQFCLLKPPERKQQVQGPDARAFPTVRLNRTRRNQQKPAWLPLVEVRQRGQRPRRITLPSYYKTEDLAREECLIYIATEAWRPQPVVRTEDSISHDQDGISSAIA